MVLAAVTAAAAAAASPAAVREPGAEAALAAASTAKAASRTTLAIADATGEGAGETGAGETGALVATTEDDVADPVGLGSGCCRPQWVHVVGRYVAARDSELLSFVGTEQ